MEPDNASIGKEELKAAAMVYHELGIPVILFKVSQAENGTFEKVNLSTWKKWETAQQTDTEFEALNWNDANALAVILGVQAKNGLYLSVIDYDCKGDNVNEAVKTKGRELLREFPITRMEETVNKGIHLVYWSRTKPKTNGTFHDTASLELLGEKKLCLMAPSLGYKSLNDNSPTEVEDLERTFLSLMKKEGLAKDQRSSEQPFRKKGPIGTPRPCITEALKYQLTGPNGHLMRLTIAGEYKRLGHTDQEIIELFRNQTDFDFEVCRAQISSAEPEKTASCASIAEWGYCLPECPLKKHAGSQRNGDKASSKTCGDCAYWRTPKCEMSADKTALKKTDNPCVSFYEKSGKTKNSRKTLKDSGTLANGCFEAIYYEDKPCFLVVNSNSFLVLESLEVDEENIFPKEARNVPYEPYGFCKDPTPDLKQLYAEVRAVFEAYIDVQDPWKDVMTAFVLLSYLQQKLQTVFYILVYGDNESGKSTVLQILKTLCYRPLYGVTIPAADIYGYLDDSDSTGVVLEDEIQGIHKDIDKVKIYKAGYKRGAIVPRTLITQNDRMIKYYNVFSLKAVASEQLPQVKGFRERFLEILMTEGYPAKEWSDVKTEDLDRFRQLRNKLLKWRMQSREDPMPDVDLKVKGRLKELWKPILQITSGLEIYDILLRFVEDQQKERLDIRQNTLEGKLVKVVAELFNESRQDNQAYFTVPFQHIWNSLKEELEGRIDEKKPNVMDTSEFFLVTKNKVGYRLREVLSGKTRAVRQKDPEGSDVVVKAYDFDVGKLRKIAKKYGFELVTKLPMLLSSEGVQASSSPLQDPQSMENIPEKEPKNNEKTPSTQQELGYISNLVTKETGPETQKTYFRRLVSSEPHPCDAQEHGVSCALLAEYLIGESNYYCEKHFQISKADCERNGYALIEKGPQNPAGTRPLNCNKCTKKSPEACADCYDFDNFQNNQTKLPITSSAKEAPPG